MSLSYEESDRVFPRLYLPIMEECHKRVFAPWREFLPMLPAYWRHRSNNRQLDTYLCAHIRGRWDALATADAAAMLPYVTLSSRIARPGHMYPCGKRTYRYSRHVYLHICRDLGDDAAIQQTETFTGPNRQV